MKPIKTLGYLLLATLTGIILAWPISMAILYLAWNYCMPVMFGLSKITWTQSLIITLGVDLFSFLFLRASTIYKFLELVLRGADKVMVIMYYIFIQAAVFLISLNCALYIWHTFIPEMFGIATPHINALTMVAFVIVFRFAIPSKPTANDWQKAEKEYNEKRGKILLEAALADAPVKNFNKTTTSNSDSNDDSDK